MYGLSTHNKLNSEGSMNMTLPPIAIFAHGGAGHLRQREAEQPFDGASRGQWSHSDATFYILRAESLMKHTKRHLNESAAHVRRTAWTRRTQLALPAAAWPRAQLAAPLRYQRVLALAPPQCSLQLESAAVRTRMGAPLPHQAAWCRVTWRAIFLAYSQDPRSHNHA